MNLPVDFINRTSELLGEELFAVFREALSKDAPVSVRVNRLKTDWCPVEKLCRNLNTPEMCVKEIAKFIASQGQNK